MNTAFFTRMFFASFVLCLPAAAEVPEMVVQNGHDRPVRELALSADGRVLASRSDDQTLKLWDLTTGLLTRTWEGGNQPFDHVAVSPDGRWIAVHRIKLGGGTMDPVGMIELLDAATGQRVRMLLDANSFGAGGGLAKADLFAFSPDGRFVAVATNLISLDGPGETAVRFIDPGTAKEAFRLQYVQAGPLHTFTIGAMAFSADGAVLYTGMSALSGSSNVRQWDLKTKKLARDYPGEDGLSVTAIAVSRDGRCVAAILGSAGTEYATSPEFSKPDPRQRIRVWDSQSGAVKANLDAAGRATGIAFDNSGAKLWVSTTTGEKEQSGLKEYAVATGQQVTSVNTGGWPGLSLASAPGSPMLAAGGADSGSIEAYDAGSGQEVLTLSGRTSLAAQVAFGRGGRSLFLARDLTLYEWNLAADGWAVASGGAAEVRFFRKAPLPDTEQIQRVGCAPDGELLVFSQRMKQWTGDGPPPGLVLHHGEKVLDLLPDSDPLKFQAGAVAFTADGRLLLATLVDFKAAATWVRAWDTATGGVIGNCGPFSRQSANFVFIHAIDQSPGKPATALIGLLGRGNWLELWDLQNSKALWQTMPLRLLDGHFVSDPGGRFYGELHDLANAADVVDMRSTQKPSRVKIEQLGKEGAIDSASFVGDGRGIAVRYTSDQTRLVDTATGNVSEAPATQPVEAAAAASAAPGATTLLSPPPPAFSPDGRLLAVALSDGSVSLAAAAGKTDIARFIFAQREGFAPDALVVTPDGYYASTARGARLAGFRLGPFSFPFNQFDLQMNRPDQVLGRIGFASPPVIDQYRRAYQLRLRRASLTPDAAGAGLDFSRLPAVEIDSAALVPITEGEVIPVRLWATDKSRPLTRLMVSVNGVPLHGAAGMPVSAKPGERAELKIDVPLSAGPNAIDFSVVNDRGEESLRRQLRASRTSSPQRRDLFVLAVGVSEYKDERYRLRFAAKDADDLATFFENQPGDFKALNIAKGQEETLDRREYHVQRLLDDKATRENIEAAKQFLAQSKVDDTVIVLFAGHGLLDEKRDYYFATADMVFERPSERGLSYGAMEGLLDGIPARHKLLLVDTCHAGEVDKPVATTEPAAEAPVAALPAGVTAGPGAHRLHYNAPAASSLADTTVLLGDLFADLRRGSGATVIAAGSGSQFAFELGNLRNGVFTHSVLEGLKGKADANHDARVTASELREYVTDRVNSLTAGKQVPTARREAIEFDFPVN